MSRDNEIRKIAFIADYVPRKCGIATFTSHLCESVAALGDAECVVVPVNDGEERYEYPPEVRFEFSEKEIDSYRRAADFLNFGNADVACVQHEFGIYGGREGSHVLALLRHLQMPIVTTLHTVLAQPNPNQQRVMRELAALSSRLVVMSERGKTFLRDVYDVPDDKIDLVPHGIPDMPFVDPNFYKDHYNVEGKSVLLTFGLLSPNKGIEVALRAMPRIIEEYPNLVYIVLGATHPNLVRQSGEAYRLTLERLTQDLGISRHVIFYDRFVELEELKQFLGAADIYITPYLNPAQITSGALAYAFGCGKAIVSTPYWHAEELLADGRGVLVPFGDYEAIASEVCRLLRDETTRHAMRKRAYLLGREMVWSNTAHHYMESFMAARRARAGAQKTLAVKTLDESRQQLPKLRLDHLFRLSDSTGIFQHARFTMPNFAEGYCTDDNARALLLTVLLEEAGQGSKELQRHADVYAAFLDYAFDRKHHRFRNFMGFDRSWLEEEGSDDSQGRAIWAIGACVGRSLRQDMQHWAAGLFDQAIPMLAETSAPRAWAFALLGIHEYFRRLTGDRAAAHLRELLTDRLVDLYDHAATPAWCWFEDRLTYDNAKLSHALILSGRFGENQRALEIGLTTLRWLLGMQKSERGWFRPVGCDGFYVMGGPRAQFDQQPLEAHSTISACIEAYGATGDHYWLAEARIAFEWYLGRNDVGTELYDATTGGCRDALHVDRANLNQGAESTLSFLLSLAELMLLEHSLTAFRQPTEVDRVSTSFLGARSAVAP
jgi:glycosyltransferase involved in cell wall biosynthesis